MRGRTYIDAETMQNIGLGTRMKILEQLIRLVPRAFFLLIKRATRTAELKTHALKEYMVGAASDRAEMAAKTIRTFPNPPAESSTAEMSPPTLFPFPSPAFQVSTPGAEAANMAPVISHKILSYTLG